MDRLRTDAETVPAYGSLSPSEEHALYERNRDAWYRYAAPGMAQKLLRGGADSIRTAWRELSEPYREAIKAALNPVETDAFRAALSQRGAP